MFRLFQSALGTNPISVVAPASQGETFYLDMATTAVSVGKVKIAMILFNIYF